MEQQHFVYNIKLGAITHDVTPKMAVFDPPMHPPCQAWSGFLTPSEAYTYPPLPLPVTSFIVHETESSRYLYYFQEEG